MLLRRRLGHPRSRDQSEERALSPSMFMYVPHLSPLPDRMYIINSLGWDGMCLSLFSKDFSSRNWEMWSGRMSQWEKEGGGWERRHGTRRGGKGWEAQGTREWQVLKGWRVVPRPYLEGVSAFQNPGW